jgi:hypothetical protein
MVVGVAPCSFSLIRWAEHQLDALGRANHFRRS